MVADCHAVAYFIFLSAPINFKYLRPTTHYLRESGYSTACFVLKESIEESSVVPYELDSRMECGIANVYNLSPFRIRWIKFLVLVGTIYFFETMSIVNF